LNLFLFTDFLVQNLSIEDLLKLPPLLGCSVSLLLLCLKLLEDFGFGPLDLFFLLGETLLALLLLCQVDQVETVLFLYTVLFTLDFVPLVLKRVKHVLVTLLLFVFAVKVFLMFIFFNSVHNLIDLFFFFKVLLMGLLNLFSFFIHLLE
jgi:hypothetical protein